MLPLCMTLSWIYFVMTIVKSVVHEKETRVKEYMKIMGLRSLNHWVSWFITQGILMTVSVVLLVLVLVHGGILNYTHWTVMFVLLESVER
jgi:hypothetical protein